MREASALWKTRNQFVLTLVIFVEGDDIGDGLFVTLIVTHNELQFDTHPGASPSSSDRRIAQPILPEFEGYPQHLPALIARPSDLRDSASSRDLFVPCTRTPMQMGY